MNKLSIVIIFSVCVLFCAEGMAEYQKKGDMPLLENPFTESYLKDNLKKSRPRLIYNEQIVEKLKGKIKTDPVIEKMYGLVRANALELLDMPVIKRDKKDITMMKASRDFLGRMNSLGLVYLIEKDKVVLERINKEVLSICAFADWNPLVYLVTAETCMGVSVALDWTCGDLPESTRSKAKQALIEKGIYPSWAEHGADMSDAWWIDHYNNWNQVCNAGMIAASISVAEDDPGLAAKTIKRALDGIPNVLNENYNPEGVCPEGVMYWNYTTMYALMTMSIFETSFDSDFGYREFPGFMESAMFKYMCSSAPSGLNYNYSDCRDEAGTGGDVLLAWFAAETGKSMYYQKERFITRKKGVLPGDITASTLSWMCRYEERSNEKPPSVWVGKGRSPVAVFKGEGDNSDYYFAAKGGCGAVSHGNLDAGSFVFELNGVRWSVDPGARSYGVGKDFDLWKQCQECQRWELITTHNHGHSTLTVDGKRHVVDGYALVNDHNAGEKPSVTFDLGPTFQGQLESAFRKFTKTDERCLLIEDDIKPHKSTKMVTWQFVTLADVEIAADGAVLRQDGKMLRLVNLSHPDIKLEVVSLDPPPHELDKQIDGLKRIELRVPVSSSGDSFGIKVLLADK